MGEALRELLDLQAGVVSRRQALDLGLTDADVRRLVRRRAWARVHPGVFVEHTGPLSWTQRAWAAVLALAPAALCHDSAIRVTDGPGRREHPDGGPIHVAVAHGRTVAAPDGVRVHHVAELETRAQWHLSPPRLRIEEALVDLAARARSDHAAIALLADAVQSRRTTPRRLSAAVDGRTRLRRRPFLIAVLADLESGACSTLEQGYLTRVERAHGLPRGIRQAAGRSSGRVYRDVEYDAFGLVVELDGRMFHDSARARDRDLDRDLAAALDGRTTIRLGWGQVFDRACTTAARIGVLLSRQGWTGTPTRCRSCPA